MTYAIDDPEDDMALSSEMPLTGELSAYVTEAAKSQPGDINFSTDETHLRNDLLLQAPVIRDHEEGAQIFCRHIERAALPVLRSMYTKSISISIHISQSPIKPPEHIDSMAAYLLFDGGKKEERQFILSPNQPPPDEKAMGARRGISVLCLPLASSARDMGIGPDPNIFQLSLRMLHAIADQADFAERDRPALDLIIALMNRLLSENDGSENQLRAALSMLLEYSADQNLSLAMRLQLRAIAQTMLRGGDAATVMAQASRLFREGSIGGPAVGPAPGFPGLHAGDQPQEEEKTYRLSDGTIVPVVFWAPGGRPRPQAAAPAGTAYEPPVAHYDTAKYPDQPHLPEQIVNSWLPNPEGGADQNTVHYETAKYPDQPQTSKPFRETDEGYEESIRDMWEQGRDPLDIAKWLMISPKLVIERARALGLGPPGGEKLPVTQYPDQQDYDINDIADSESEPPGYGWNGYAVQIPSPVENRSTAAYADAAAYASAAYANAGQAPTVRYEQATLAPVQNLSTLSYAQASEAPAQPIYNSPAYQSAVYQETAAASEQKFASQTLAEQPADQMQAAASEVGGETPAPANIDGPGTEAPRQDTANHQTITQTDIPQPEPETAAPGEEQTGDEQRPDSREEPHPEEPERNESESHEQERPEPDRQEEPRGGEEAEEDVDLAHEAHEAHEAAETENRRAEPEVRERREEASVDRAPSREERNDFNADIVGGETFESTPGGGLAHHLMHHILDKGFEGGHHIVGAAPAFHHTAFVAPASGPATAHAAFAAAQLAPHHFGPLTFRPNGFYHGLAAKPAPRAAAAMAAARPSAKAAASTAAAPNVKISLKVPPKTAAPTPSDAQQQAYHNALLHNFPTPDPGFNIGGRQSKAKK